MKTRTKKKKRGLNEEILAVKIKKQEALESLNYAKKDMEIYDTQLKILEEKKKIIYFIPL